MRKLYYLLFAILLLSNNLKAQKVHDLKPVSVYPHPIADTVFGTWKFSVADYEFQDDKLLLLTYEKSLEHAKVVLIDGSQKVISSFEIPDEAKKLYKDYQGYTNVICEKNIYRITIINNEIHLGELPADDYKRHIMPCLDTIGKDIYFSNYDRDYPEFTYYAYNTSKESVNPFKTVCDKEQLQGYNMEYYFLQSKQKLLARQLADEYKVDKHRIAVMMTGLTNAYFYTPLYSPLFIINDTVCIFDHCSNAILKYDNSQHLLDSITIDYNHPKNWREWKHQIIVDKETNKVYAVYQKNGFYYLKNIDMNTGKIVSSFKLSNQYVDKLKVKNNEVYYVYSPFESVQEFFIYKEAIRN